MLGTEPQLIATYVDPGQLKIIFWPIVDLGPNSLNAAAAAHCAGLQEAGDFWQLHDIFFENQGALFGAGRDYFVATAADAGVNQAQFESCYDGGEVHAFITELDQRRRDNGIRSRPSFEINGRLIAGAQPFPVFQEAIEAALANE